MPYTSGLSFELCLISNASSSTHSCKMSPLLFYSITAPQDVVEHLGRLVLVQAVQQS